MLRFQARIRRNHDVALDALVVWYHVTDAALDRIAPDQPVETALQDFDDRPFAASTPIHAGYAAEHAVAMQCLAHPERRQEQVIATTRIRAQESETIGIGDHHARDQTHLRSRCEAAATVLQQLAVAQHRSQTLVQRIEAVGFRQAQLLGERVGIHRAVGSGQQLDDHLATGDRLFVASGFTRSVGIAQRAIRCCARSAASRCATRCATHCTHQRRVRHPARASFGCS